MIWGLLALLLVLILLAIPFARQGLLRILPVVIVAFVAIIAFMAWLQDKDLKASKQRLAFTDIELVDVHFDEGGRGIRHIAGRIRNKSRDYTLDEMRLRVVLKDCVGETCDVVDQVEATLRTDVPHGQSRDFRESLYFKSLVEPRGKYALSYEIVETRAK